jgi:glycosyltransferase involved in cell wall biosynthesis
MHPNKKVAVIITTRDRPEMLAQALESVRRQTAPAVIGQVVVSENGLTDASRAVCDQFKDLPLCYLRQEPPVPSLLHLKAFMHRVESPNVAILHDDDWWLPDHLERALEALESHPDCVATYSNFYDSWGPSTVPYVTEKAWRVWVSSSCDFSAPLLMLDPLNVLLACMLESTFHYSTLVGRKEAVWDAYYKLVAAGNDWDNERTFPVFLSTLGRIGYLTRHNAFVRNHPGQLGFDPEFAAKGFGELRAKTTRWLAQLDTRQTALAAKHLNGNIVKIRQDGDPHDFVGMISSRIEEPQKSVLITEFGFNLVPSPVPVVMPPPKKDKIWLAKQLLPPAVLAVRRKLKAAAKKPPSSKK